MGLYVGSPGHQFTEKKSTCKICGTTYPGEAVHCMDCFGWAWDIGIVIRDDESAWRYRGEINDGRLPSEMAHELRGTVR